VAYFNYWKITSFQKACLKVHIFTYNLFWIHFNSILQFMPPFPKWSFSSGFSNTTACAFASYMPCPSHSPDWPTQWCFAKSTDHEAALSCLLLPDTCARDTGPSVRDSSLPHSGFCPNADTVLLVYLYKCWLKCLDVEHQHHWHCWLLTADRISFIYGYTLCSSGRWTAFCCVYDMIPERTLACTLLVVSHVFLHVTERHSHDDNT
jgi:hypothetical protein